MFDKGFYLLVENTFESCYLTSCFVDQFKLSSHFLGVLAAEDQPPQDILNERKLFHSEYGGKKDGDDEMEKKWHNLYQPLDEPSRKMIHLYGVPNFLVTHRPDTLFLGTHVNGSYAKNGLKDICEKNTPWLVTYLLTRLKSWWIEFTQSRILSCHSAVLPYARGMHAIENIATLKDLNAFQPAAGITIHYIDTGVDTGPIIRAERVSDPFRFNSIWELKAYLYAIGVEWYARTLREILDSTGTTPVGIVPSPDLYGQNYMRKHFTTEKRQQAEEGYVWMKSQVKKPGKAQEPVRYTVLMLTMFLFNLENAVGRGKDVLEIDVHSEFRNHVVTLLVISECLNLLGASRSCVDFHEPTAFFRFNEYAIKFGLIAYSI